MRDRTGKRKVLIGVLVLVLAVVGLALVMHLIETHGLLDEQFGDSGNWGEDNEPVLLTYGEKDYVTEDDIDAYLIAGTDGGGIDQGEGYNGDLADFITVLIIDNTTKKYGFYQIDRNTMVDVAVREEDGSYPGYATQQICTAHWYGVDDKERNSNLVDAAVIALGGIEIDGYYVLNMKDIGAVNDAIGGVVVDIDTDMTKLDPAFVKGASIKLTGDQADKFLRARSDVGEGTNKERMSRQTQYMRKAYSMIIDQLRENPEYINDLYDQLESKVQSDGTGKRISNITNQIVTYENAGIISFEGKVKLNDTIGEGIVHEEFYADPESVLSNLCKVVNITEDTSAEEEE